MSDGNVGYAVETEDGKIIKMHNFATARYYVQNGLAKRIIDLVFNRYVK